MTGATPLGIYVHVPFCRVHCPYCDFYTYPDRRGRQGEFSAAVCAEIALVHRRLDPGRFVVETIYFGGGTPSLLPLPQLELLLSAICGRFALSANAEVTLEANPREVTREYLDAWFGAGINRLSLGVQSFEAARLEFLGRDHGPAEVRRALELVAPWRDWGADLIFGSGGQTAAGWKRDLDLLLAYRPPHLSVYGLTVEPKTRLASLVARGRLPAPDPDRDAQLYRIACATLAAAGLEHYEISNFALPGHRSRHNSGYWQGRYYLGLGPSASSRLPGRNSRNAHGLTQYLYRLQHSYSPVTFVEVPTPAADALDQVWLGLRTSDGIAQSALSPQAGALLDRARARGLIVNRPAGRIALTDAGMAVADDLVARLLLTAPSEKNERRAMTY